LGGLDTLLRQRDQLRRLHILEMIGGHNLINPGDAHTVARVLMQGRNHILAERQNRLIHALMDK